MPKYTMPPPTDEEILACRNVPVDLAARYIGWSTATIYNALKQERAPFGIAVQNPKSGSWAFNISPGLLVRYKRGDLPTYRLNEVIHLAADGVEEVLNLRMEGLRKVMDLVGDPETIAAQSPERKRRKSRVSPATVET